MQKISANKILPTEATSSYIESDKYNFITAVTFLTDETYLYRILSKRGENNAV